MSDSLWPHGLQHARLPCPSLTPGAYSNSYPSSRWCHPTNLSSIIPFSSHLRSFPASGLFKWVSSSSIVQLSHPYMTTGKTLALARWTFVGKVISVLFNLLSRLVIAFLPRGKHLLISWLQSPSTVILDVLVIQSCPTLCDPMDYSLPVSSVNSPDKNIGVGCCSHLQGVFPLGSDLGFLHCRQILYCLRYQGSPSDFEVQENKVCHCFHCFPIYLLWSDVTGCHDLSFLNVEF